jgi:hypothetical protein
MLLLIYLWLKRTARQVRSVVRPASAPARPQQQLCGVCGGRGCGFCGLSGWS